ncbi:hypothetical protein NUACC26_088310 [Scytonema sp. NUACC26]
MNKDSFPVILSFEAHSLAQENSKQHQHLEKAKQVYLNTLAIYAVEFYFQIMAIETDYDKSDSYNLLTRKLRDIADLYVKNLGKFECCPVLPYADILKVHPDAWDNRTGYIAVQLNQSLKEAKLIGFTPEVASKKGIVPLSELRSMEEFTKYLSQKQDVDLEKWLKNISNVFTNGWQAIEPGISVLLTQQREGLAGAFRRGGQSEIVDPNLPESVKRWIAQVYASQSITERSQANSLADLDPSSALTQLIKSTQDVEIQWQAADYLWQINPNYFDAGQRGFKDLGVQLAGYPVALILTILPIHSAMRAIRLQVSMTDLSYLPSGLKLIVMDESGNLIKEVSAREKDNYIQFKFIADSGDRFSVKVALADASITEFFTA